MTGIDLTPFFVKICGCRDLENARALAALGVDALGFIFVADSPRALQGAIELEAISSLDGRVKKIGVFADAEPGNIVNIVRRGGLDAIQLHGQETPLYVDELRQAFAAAALKVALSKAIDGSAIGSLGVDLLAFARRCDWLVVDSRVSGRFGGTGAHFDWHNLQLLPPEVPFIVAGGIGPEDIGELLKLRAVHPRMLGCDLNSKVELAVGVKDLDSVRQIIEEIRRAQGN